MDRPLVVITLCFICGLTLGHYVSISISFLFVISLLLLIISAILIHHEKDASVIILVLAGLLGVIHIERTERNNRFRLAYIDSISKYSPINLTGRVVDSSHRTNGEMALTIDRVKFYYNQTWYDFSGQILVILPAQENISVDSNSAKEPTRYFYGDRIQVYGTVQIAPEPANPGEFNYREYLLQEEIYGIVNCWNAADIQNLSVSSFGVCERILRLASKIKYYYVCINNATLPPTHAALLNGIVLGEKTELADDIKEAFIRSGIFHLLVVSGSNVMLIAVIVFVVLKVFRVKRRIAALVSIPLVILYALVAGYQPPVSRATIIAVMVLLGLATKQDVQIINNLGIAALIALIVNPLDIFGASFQLSFLTVLSIILIYPILQQWMPFPKKLFSVQLILYSSIAAFIGIAPLSAYYFNLLPLISPVTNLLAVPIVTINLSAGLVSGIVYPFSPALTQLVANTNWLLLTILMKVVTFFYFIPGSYIYVARPALWVIVLYYLFLQGFIYGFYPTVYAPNYAFRKKWLVAVWGVLLLIVVNALIPWNRNLELTFLSVGQGDSAFIKFPNGKTMLIDGGDYSAGKRIVIPYLRRQGVHHLNTVVLSHPHNDHLGGLIHVLSNIPVEMFIDSNQMRYDSEYYPKLYEIINKKNIKTVKVAQGYQISLFSRATITILHPPTEFLQTTRSETNNNSIVLRVIYGKVTTIFPGDIEQEAERYLVRKRITLAATIYKVPHHGSASSNELSFLRSVRPEIAIISVGRNNWFNLPSLVVLESLKKDNAQIYRTDINGAIRLWTDGDKIKIASMRD
ncbi:MAG: DNA internalization-related competence protein ComEC/Rec2 [bacterium]|nr:DNA internalization-related competence protein ComEC/Rec2 [bacterium]